jgi:serine/threonine protein kinase
MAKSRKSAAKKKSSKVGPTVTLGHIESLWGDSIAPDDTPGMTIKRRRDTVRAPSQLNVKTHSIEKAGRAGDVPPDYELSNLLGEGGMGLVYEARQTSIDRSIALKMIKGKSPDAKTKASSAKRR